VASAQERDAEFTGVAAHGYGNKGTHGSKIDASDYLCANG
jgi:hypothetical protein